MNESAGWWQRRVWRLAGPIILSNLSVPLVGAVDTAVMGRLPDAAYIGAVAVAAVVFGFISWGFNFLRMGTTGFTAQAQGRGDRTECLAVLLRGLLIGAVGGFAIVALQGPLIGWGLPLMDASAQVTGLAETYLLWRVWGAPATLAGLVILGWLVGMQRTGAVFRLQLFLNGLNVALNLLFVMGLGWDVDGVAVATVIAEWTALLLGLWEVRRVLGAFRPLPERARLLAPERLLALFRVNRDIFLRTLAIVAVHATFTALGAKLGDRTLAANAILLQLLQFTAYGLDGFAYAVEALAGEAAGRRDRGAFRAAVRASSLSALAVACLLGGLFLLAGPWIVAAFTTLPAVRAETLAFLPWMALLPLVAVWPYLLDGIFTGATRTAPMRDTMILAAAVFLAGAWLLVPPLGNHGLWIALLAFNGARGVGLGLCYPRLERSVAPAVAELRSP